ncbi:MAG: methyltransferase domain-containing protein [Thiocapsa sp.]|uniref:methyltransferase domain-containing protein n=1 Tax=Thiocapsa sp. TaxID=2024551 RepID=UPI001BCD173A|nr:methyltransferase domain-containing protein [Thiocapsa sp.]QVL50295.1 MAG: methyltransferase domain-containing protein [Thiocapsa sp.]
MFNLTDAVLGFSKRARAKRNRFFRNSFRLTADTRILDLGSESGQNITNVLSTTPIQPKNVYIADIDNNAIERGKESFGFVPVLLNEDGLIPFPDDFFDIVYCSSVIEHVTLPKEDVWLVKSEKEFRRLARTRQQQFANEIKRVGKQYFVQTPYRYFPIESHSWLPLVAFLPRFLLLFVISATNRFWIKQTIPDWHLLTNKELQSLFSDATIVKEVYLGMPKSLIAIRRAPYYTGLT